MDRAEWLRAHPYLAQIADFQAKVEEAAGAGPALIARPEAWSDAHARGAAALKQEPLRTQAIEAGAAILGPLVERLADAALPDALKAGVLEIRERFRTSPDDARHAAEWVVNGGTAEAPLQPGLLRYLAWTALAAALAPAIRAVEAIAPKEEGRRWEHATCPTCGALPVTAALVAQEDGRARRFSCGLCRTRWTWKRIGCPYCQNEDPKRLDLFEIDGEPGLRLDACQGCTGYVKTVTAEGAPDLLVADWSTVHLDALARSKGYRRLGASLYEL
jgi:FdhE protein